GRLKLEPPGERYGYHGSADGRDRARLALVRREARAEGHLHVHSPPPGDRVHRPLRLWQDDAPALPEPDERPGRWRADGRQHPDRRGRHPPYYGRRLPIYQRGGAWPRRI